MTGIECNSSFTNLVIRTKKNPILKHIYFSLSI